MSAYERTFERMVEDRVKEERQRHIEAILAGLPQEAYRHEAGYVAALDRLIEIFEEVRKAIMHE